MQTGNNQLKPYPVFLIGLENRHCVVIGGGKEAAHKVEGLLACDATVTVISPILCSQLSAWAEQGRFTWMNRSYHAGDLRGAFLVIAERGDPGRSAQIFAEAEAERALVNMTDDVPHCNFIAGSVVRQGDLVITISTSGAAPALAVRLREQFEETFGAEYGEFLALMGALRQPVAALIPQFQERRRLWYELVDSEVLDLLREGKREQAGDKVIEILGEEFQRSGS